jgi:RHS repeat-associated protein
MKEKAYVYSSSLSRYLVTDGGDVALGVGLYRYGFNGKENDNEIKGEGNQQDYGMRIYDPRIARFLSVDPLTQSYPNLSPYPFAENSPIKFIDLDGAEKMDPDKYYKSAIPKIKMTFAKNLNYLPESERSSTESAISTAFNRVHLFTFYGRYLSARFMTRWMEGQGGYDVLSYRALSSAGGSWLFNHVVNGVEKDVKSKVLSYASSLAKPGSYDVTVSSYDNHLQGGAVLSDVGTAFGSFNIYATGTFTIDVGKDGKKQIYGDVYYTLADRYQWKKGTGTNLEEEVNHDSMLKLEKIGAKPFYIRAYFQASYSGDGDKLKQVGDMKDTMPGRNGTANPSPEPRAGNGYAKPDDARKINDSRGE